MTASEARTESTARRAGDHRDRDPEPINGETTADLGASMLTPGNGRIKFKYHIPIYNWYYPLHNLKVPDSEFATRSKVFDALETDTVSSRALYFHIPFCDTICSFCPFVRGKYGDGQAVDRYAEALIREIEIKGSYRTLHGVPVRAIFFGGGTPSILEPRQILSIGKAISRNFDLSQLEEFSFEFEVKSVDEDRIAALKEIGVTHARFGLQTFNPLYRELFTLTASLEQVGKANDLLKRAFKHVSFDVLYGMNGQTIDDFIKDVYRAVQMGTDLIDFYPINNYAAQLTLHQKYSEKGLRPTSALTKYAMNMLLRELMGGYGFLPHNGHGYYKAASADRGDDTLDGRTVVGGGYSFKYHKHVYGYSDTEVVGFGASAISLFKRFMFRNIASRSRYCESLLEHKTWDFVIGVHSKSVYESKAVVLHLPYHGEVQKSRVDWSLVRGDTLASLLELVDAGLVVDDGDRYILSRDGWYWYANLMYYLSPAEERMELDKMVQEGRRQRGRHVEDSRIELDRFADSRSIMSST